MGEIKSGYQPKEEKPNDSFKSKDTFKPKDKTVDYVNHPPHYTSRPMECIDEMLTVFGEKAVFWFCSITAWKYRHRAGQKGPVKEDLAKSDWYINKAAEIKSKLKYPNELYNNGVE